jgi:hypothetical protein
MWNAKRIGENQLRDATMQSETGSISDDRKPRMHVRGLAEGGWLRALVVQMFWREWLF